MAMGSPMTPMDVEKDQQRERDEGSSQAQRAGGSSGQGWLRQRALVMVVGVVALLALAGGALATSAVLSARQAASGFHLTQDVKTSFGVIAAESMATHTGPDTISQVAKVQVRPDEVQVQVVVAITNESSAPISYTPTQFTLLSDKSATPIAAAASSLTHASLLPRASIEGRLVFVAPPGAHVFTLRFADPGKSQPILIELHY